MSMTITFARNLLHLRKEKGWSQDMTARKLYVSRQLLGFIEQGKASVSLRVVERTCTVFEVDLIAMTQTDMAA